jgi:hypothetical protein
MKLTYVEKAFNVFEDIETQLAMEDSVQIPEPGDAIRTKKMQMEGKVERVAKNRAGYDEVFFRVGDGRLMKTPLENVIIIQKLADEDHKVMETELNEISNELLARYKTAAGKQANEADKKGDFKKGNKRFSGIVKATNKQFDNDAKKSSEKTKKVPEGMMGGINRVPNPGLSHEDVLNELLDRWHGYTADDPKANALAKAPKNAKQGTLEYPLDQMIKSNIEAHGLKWAFNYHVLTHGLPPKEFQILAGLVPKKY